MIGETEDKMFVDIRYEVGNCPLCGRNPKISKSSGFNYISCSHGDCYNGFSHKLTIIHRDVVKAIDIWNSIGMKTRPFEKESEMKDRLSI